MQSCKSYFVLQKYTPIVCISTAVDENFICISDDITQLFFLQEVPATGH